MTQEEWPARLANRVAAEVRRHRMRREMSAQQLSDACVKLGLPLSRSALANFESGRRPTVSVAEVITLGKALGVPPIELVFPVGQSELSEVLPGQEMGTWQALRWFAGEDSFATRFPDDGKWYASDDDQAALEGSATYEYRWHDIYMKQCLDADSAAKAARRAAGAAETEAEANAHLKHAKSEEAQYRTNRKLLRDHRQRMRLAGITPPELWGLLADIDDDPARGHDGQHQETP